MEYTWIVQTGTLLGIGAIGWFIKTAMADIKEKIKSNEGRVDQLEQKLENLKADLPFIYTTREDFIRTMNNVDKKLEKIHDVLLATKGGT